MARVRARRRPPGGPLPRPVGAVLALRAPTHHRGLTYINYKRKTKKRTVAMLFGCFAGPRSSLKKEISVEKGGFSPDNAKTMLNPTYAHTQGVSGLSRYMRKHRVICGGRRPRWKFSV